MALHKLTPDYLAFNIDKPLDVRQNERCNSGTPYRKLLKKGYLRPQNFYEIAVKPMLNADHHLDYVKEKGANLITLSRIMEKGIGKLFEELLDRENIDSIFWGIDMDSVDSDDAPGVSAPYPIGLSSAEICRIAQIACSDERSRILEISEVNPESDNDNRTSRLVADVILHFIEAAMVTLDVDFG
jgi:formiminoglutamase